MSERSETSQTIEAVAWEAAQKAADIQRSYYESNFRTHKKGDIDLVTSADLEAEKAIVQTISGRFPGHAILAEESQEGHQQSLEGPIWIIDPLDGTTNFSHGFPVFGVSIAYREKNETQFGLIYQPLLNERFTAHKQGGAYLNGEAITVSNRKTISESLLATGFPYDRRTSPNNNLDLFSHFELTSQCVRRAGAATIDLAYVACGRIDGFWEPKLSAWDVAAGSLLVEEAGGIVTDYSGDRLKDLWKKEIVAGNPEVHSELLREIGKIRAKAKE